MVSKAQLPNLIVAGAAKAGTTSLYAYLKGHPEVYLPERKESRFFASEKLVHTLGYNRTSVFGWEQFCQGYAGAGPVHKVRADFGNLYMIYPELAIANIKRYLGQEGVKVVFMVRNPVTRAYSAYQMARRNFYEDADFEQALDREDARLAQGYVPCDIIAYQKMGCYTAPIRMFMESFDVKVLVLEELQANAGSVYGELCDFLGIAALPLAGLGQVHNQGGSLPADSGTVFRVQRAMKRLRPALGFVPGLNQLAAWTVGRLAKAKLKGGAKPAPPLEELLRRRLETYFYPDVAALGHVLGKDLLSLWGFSQSKNIL
jgi:hypothetical protein